jgi:hypothetical protein
MVLAPEVKAADREEILKSGIYTEEMGGIEAWL